nr:copia protein [Tanacetum cinerariifolium]
MRPFGYPVIILNTLDPLGSGPTWLFDIDTLTKSINYKPIVAENQSNGCTGFTGAGCKPSGKEEKKDAEGQGKKDSEVLSTEEPRINQENDENVNNTNKINVTVYSDDDEDVSVEADITNLDTHIPVSPILTTRIHKDHLVKQTIKDLHSTPQTRRMTKNVTNYEPKKATGTKWIYKNKKDERGIMIRNKARLVAQGYTQKERIDYDEGFAPVSMIEPIRVFLAYALFKDFIVYQMDVKSAFLYGRIEEKVYVYQPLGFEDLKFPNKVYKVEKALYGLHQAPRA